METVYSAKEKLEVLQRHVFENIPVEELCTEYTITSGVLNSWYKDLFLNGEFALQQAEKKRSRKAKTWWHAILARMLDELLSPFQIEIYTNLPIMTYPPEADIIIIRRKGEKWTSEQRELLFDGVRDTEAQYIILEFKYTESVNKKTFLQALIYDSLYKRSKKLSDRKVQTFLISSKTPAQKTLKECGYYETDQPGIYKTDLYCFSSIILLDLNKLPNEQHNAYLKCFASHKKEKKLALNTLKQKGISSFSHVLQNIINGLWLLWFNVKGENKMDIQLTPEIIADVGKMWGKEYLANLTVEEKMKGIPVSDRLKGIPIADIVENIPVSDRLKNIPVSDRLKNIPVSDRFEDIPVSDIIENIPADKLRAYLKKLDQDEK